MIHEEICTYEVCKLAKEKGFPQHPDKNGKCGIYILYKSKNTYVLSDWTVWISAPWGSEAIAAPTQSLLQRWLREEKNIHIEIIATASGYYWCVNKTNGTSITDSDVLNRGTNDGGCFDTYELALEDALKYALENLV